MATSVVFPRVQFFANNGHPLVGGRVHTYVAGSSTRARTYKDAAKAQPNANPIILDARGEASVYLADGVEYKFVIEDSTGALIMTQEPVYGAVWPNAAEWPSDATLSYQYMTDAKAAAGAIGPVKFYDTKAQADAAIGTMANGDIIEISQDETRAGARTRYKVQAGALVFVVNLDQVRLDLANTTDIEKGAALVSFVPAGLGAVSTDVKNALRKGVMPTPQNFGAVGDGVADDTLAVQKWAAAASGNVQLNGTYRVNRTILFQNKTGVVVHGGGAVIGDAATWAFTGGYRGILAFYNCTDSGIGQGVKLVGVRKSNPAAAKPWEDGDSGVEFNSCSRPFMRGVWVDNTMAWGVLGQACTDTLIDACKISNVTRQSGVNIAVGGSTGGRVLNCTIEDVGLYGIESESAELATGMRYAGNTIRRCQKGIAIVNANSDVTVMDNFIDECVYGVSVNGTNSALAKSIFVKGNVIDSCLIGVEFANARGTHATCNQINPITSDTFLRKASYHSVISVTAANQFTAANVAGTSTFSVGDVLQFRGVAYTVSAAAYSVDATYGNISTITLGANLPSGVTEGEMFKTLHPAASSVGFIDALESYDCSVVSNTFKSSALAFQLRGPNANVYISNNHLNNCATLVWFDGAGVDKYHIKAITHQGNTLTGSIGGIGAFSANGDIEGRKALLFYPAKSAADVASAFHYVTTRELLFGLTVTLKNATCTGQTVIKINGTDYSVFVPGDYVAAGLTQKTLWLSAAAALPVNTIQNVQILDTVGDLAFASAHVTLHVL